MSVAWLNNEIKIPDINAQKYAENRQNFLTKPQGSLGKLEQIAIQFSAWQGVKKPQLNRIHISIFAADHGIAESGVSAFPQAVTAEMVKNFVRGGAAVSVLAREMDANLEIIDVGVKDFPHNITGVISARAGNATNNFSQQQAMNSSQLSHALMTGYEAVQRAFTTQADLFIGGEMGIANTSSSTALACLVLNQTAQTLTGVGTGLNPTAMQHKAKIIETALHLHTNKQQDHLPLNVLDILKWVGGFEIAALVGAYIRCAQLGLPILVDGFITTVAALVAVNIQPAVKKWMLFAHISAELGHKMVLKALNRHAVLNLEMRLGEGSGACIAVPTIHQALALHNNMATFNEAGVSEKS